LRDSKKGRKKNYTKENICYGQLYVDIKILMSNIILFDLKLKLIKILFEIINVSREIERFDNCINLGGYFGEH